jgi:hypothetical protein
MSIQAVAWALDQDLPGKAKLILVSIANHADHTNGYCWLRTETIAKEASTPERSVYRYLGALVRNGYLRKEQRKGKDGKQRANDYWIMFQREKVDWDWGAHASDDADGDAQDAVEPTATVAVGEPVENTVPTEPETHDLAVGPSAIGGSRDMDEPSKTKPSRESSLDTGGPPRGYVPPPMGKPVKAPASDEPPKQFFVFEGTRAWDAWVAHKRRERGAPWSLTTTAVIEGKLRRGWYFPSLFPPSQAKPQQPTEKARGSPSMTPDDEIEAAKMLEH